MDLLSFFVGSDRELSAYVRLLSIQTEQLLTLHWKRVRLLARELAKRNEMSGRAIRQLLRGDFDRAPVTG